ncbi:hypothetical protein C7S18_20075 [Ahniella affigens]|uniref:Conjugal transfer protein TrbC n=1 Tax=Ahniella affigens TaxID=2021234 RepID=A0A2P1PWW7_9GAMM|nr:TrbC/VirB2 family protein [Ahniella affigens]AVP99326.1 hypothetical protein C7S18_20075 [Ahniella affigens]
MKAFPLIATALIAALLLLIPDFAFAGNVADDELAPLVQKIFDYLEGSVGLGIVIVAFVVAAIAAIAQRLIVFLSAFGLLIIVKYGPQVILNFFGATLDGLASLSPSAPHDLCWF